PVKHVSVSEAHALQSKGAVYVDVRSTAEFAAGHPAGAVNIPLIERDDETGEMMPNPDFVRVVKANFEPGTPLLLGCQMGGRSMRAAEILQTFGYADVANVRGGFGGARQQGDPGWADSGLPVDVQPQPGASYAEQLAK